MLADPILTVLLLVPLSWINGKFEAYQSTDLYCTPVVWHVNKGLYWFFNGLLEM